MFSNTGALAGDGILSVSLTLRDGTVVAATASVDKGLEKDSESETPSSSPTPAVSNGMDEEAEGAEANEIAAVTPAGGGAEPKIPKGALLVLDIEGLC